MRSPIAGASVLITGAASGIGKELALSAAHRGATQVIIWDIDAEAAHAVVREIQSFGGSATAYRVDLADPAHVAAAGEETIAAYGRVDILINSAGIVTGKEFLDLTEEDITRTFNLNVFALYRVTKVFLPGMIARGKGSITAITSAAGLIGVARQTDYSASKFAATGFIESLRAELRHRGTPLHTLNVQPFYVNTGMFDGVNTRIPLLLPILDVDDVAAKILDAIESGRQSLVLPRFAALIKVAKILPVPVLDRVLDLFGINATMDHFRGRAASRPAPED
ncbi:SDR family oxidoreductase [Flaviflexus huanghaiensis]|uniref:SDR family oxidoreductase n=1 Tax=Flaviflexus huanghaiensis TaxID=1111473 RepID=UPI0015F93935|nr:SDR family oxidoreductase [Flaviflexus huanghaiensis]